MISTGTVISTFCIIFANLYALSIATNLKDIQPSASWTANQFAIDLLNKSRTAKSYNQNTYGSHDYETDYYSGRFILKKFE